MQSDSNHVIVCRIQQKTTYSATTQRVSAVSAIASGKTELGARKVYRFSTFFCSMRAREWVGCVQGTGQDCWMKVSCIYGVLVLRLDLSMFLVSICLSLVYVAARADARQVGRFTNKRRVCSFQLVCCCTYSHWYAGLEN